MSDRSAITNLCLLGTLIFLVLSSGVLQCAYNCMEADASRHDSLSSNEHVSHVVDCHPFIPEPKQAPRCPDRSCHQNQAGHQSLAEPVLTAHSNPLGPVLGGTRLTLPDLRIGQPLRQKELHPPLLLASLQPPTTISQALRSVRVTVLLN